MARPQLTPRDGHHRFFQAMKWIVALAGILTLASILWLWIRPAFQRSLTFFPTRERSEALERVAAAGDFVRWKDRQGRALGWHSKLGDPQRPLVVFHGNAGYALHRLWLAALLQEAAPEPMPRIYLLEYPGYGDRAGAPSQRAFTQAACEAMQTLEARAVVVGESIGTGVAAQVASSCPERIRGLVLLTPFDSLVRVAAHHYSFLPVQILMADRFDSMTGLKNFSAPAAFLVAEQDEVTPAEGGRALYEGYSGPKRLWLIAGAQHNDAAALLDKGQWRNVLSFAWGGEIPEDSR